jgi:hypothetical protein
MYSSIPALQEQGNIKELTKERELSIYTLLKYY